MLHKRIRILSYHNIFHILITWPPSSIHIITPPLLLPHSPSIQGAPDQQFMAKFEVETLLGLMPSMDSGYNAYGGAGGGMYGMGGGMGAWGASPYGMQAAGGGYAGQEYAQAPVDPYYGYQQQMQQTSQQTQPAGSFATCFICYSSCIPTAFLMVEVLFE